MGIEVLKFEGRAKLLVDQISVLSIFVAGHATNNDQRNGKSD